MTKTQEPPKADAEKKEEKQVLIHHKGEGYGPMDTAHGRLSAGQTLLVPASIAKKLVAAYRHVQLASDIIPGGAKAAGDAATEKSALQAQVKKLEASLVDSNTSEKSALEKVAALEAELEEVKIGHKGAEDKVNGLILVVREFLAADSKKALEALQEKHKLSGDVPGPSA